MNSRLQDKSIVIVGGTSGLGSSAAMACVREGARVVVVGRGADKCQAALASLGPSARAVVGDASDVATAQRAVDTAVAEFGRLDGLYHVAGGSGRQQGDGPLDKITDAGWHYTVQLNLTSLFYSNRAAVQQFLRQGTGGTVLNMSSVLVCAPSPAYFDTHAYATTKAAALGLTKAAAAYYAHLNIRFNAVAPALVDTPLTQRARTDEEIMRYVRSKQPLDGGRVGKPDDLDDAVIYFLSDQSRYVTGQTLFIDGGWSVTEGRL
jgi:NAD(P)-dependent dehydrogenase (short-subunit alcohol dehydrogenase family)